tara:strand:+ start:9513 stop:10268 length:756 start_codon:yes stop_codon:yes gene_type:complete
MTLLATDTKLYGSAAMPENETDVNIGGVIDLTTLISFTRLDVDSIIEVVSDNAADTMNITLTGRAPNGTLLTETVALNGLTVVDVPNTFKRLLKVELAVAAAGTITVRKDAAAGDLMSFPAGVTTIRRPFMFVAADVATGLDRVFYEKIFFRNDNATDALLTATIALGVNPGGVFAFDLDATLDANSTNGVGNNRSVAPVGFTFDGTEKSVPGGDLTEASAIGIWLELSLAKGAAAADEEFRLDLSGTDVS